MSGCHISLFTADGYSMWPFVRRGQRLIIKKTLASELAVGDVVLYKANSQLICHRLVRKKVNDKINFYMRGDNSGPGAEQVSEDMILGKVVGIIRDNKSIDFTSRHQKIINRIIVIIAPFVSSAARFLKPWAAILST